MLRTVLSVLAGVVVGVCLALLLSAIGDYVFPWPPDVDRTDPESLKSLAGRMPAGAAFMTAVAWGVGAFVASVMGIRMSHEGVAWPGWAAAGVVLLSAVVATHGVPYPIWSVVLTLIAVPAAGYGAGWMLLRQHGQPHYEG